MALHHVAELIRFLALLIKVSGQLLVLMLVASNLDVQLLDGIVLPPDHA